MTRDIMNFFLEKLADPDLGLTQVEAYEGQFEDPADSLILPPAVFVALDRGSNSLQVTTNLDYSVSLYLCTTHIHLADPGSMLDLIDALVDALHSLPVRINERYAGRCFYTGFEWLGIFPGFSCYKLAFTIKG